MPAPISDGTVPWPAEAARNYVAKGYWAGVPLGTLLREVADQRPDAPALSDPAAGVRLTHAELADRAESAAARLLEFGLRPGDRIIVQLGNGWEFVVLTLACLHAGIVPVMALPAHRRTELSYLAVHAEATAIAVTGRIRGFDHEALAHALADDVASVTSAPWRVLVASDHGTGDDGTSDNRATGSIDLRALCGPGEDSGADRKRLDQVHVDSRDVAVFLLSGGTTGLPKLIARTHDDYAYNARRSAEIACLDADSVYLVSLPAGHNFPLACPGILGTLLSGGRVVTLPSPEPARAFATIEAEGVTHTAVVPAVAARWLDHAEEADQAGHARYAGHTAEYPEGSRERAEDSAERPTDPLATLRVLQVGGARLPDELARDVRPVMRATLQQVFGMAEGLLNYTRLDDPEEVICTTQGRPMCPDDEVRLVDELDRDVPEGEPGSLLTRGPYTPRGYYKAAEQNARAFTSDGWYRSGDICRRTTDGNLIVEGRDKDMINRGGEKISSEEVENLVYQLPGVAQVAAVAMPDPLLGERLCVYVVARSGHSVTLDEIRDAMETVGVARFKIPERLEVVPELPSTKVGKIDKKALRADIAERLNDESAARTEGGPRR
jgi:non-ribosomal peptide synthetase component E (peptide arylation enzyme)